MREDNVSPSLVVFGESVSVPSDLVAPSTADRAGVPIIEFVRQLKVELDGIRLHMRRFDKALQAPDPNLFDQEDRFPTKFAWIRDPIRRGVFAPKAHGPYEVLDDSNFPVIELLRDGNRDKINIDRLIPAYGVETPGCGIDDPYLAPDFPLETLGWRQELQNLTDRFQPRQQVQPNPPIAVPPVVLLPDQSRYGRVRRPVDRHQ